MRLFCIGLQGSYSERKQALPSLLSKLHRTCDSAGKRKLQTLNTNALVATTNALVYLCTNELVLKLYNQPATMKILLPFLLFLLLPVLLPGQLEKDIAAYLNEVNATNEVPGSAVAILRGDKLIYEGYFGLAELNHRVPVSKRTMFRIYSSTKLIISVAVFQLIEAERISLTNPENQHGVERIKQLSK
jgi:hypothetical protein